MSIAAIVSLLIAIAQAIPSLSSLCNFLITKLESYEKARIETDAAKRLEAKNAMVSDAVKRVSVGSAIQQQPKTN